MELAAALMCFLLLLPRSVSSWQSYAEPLELDQPNEDGIYLFDLTLTKDVTMTLIPQGCAFAKCGYLIDYDPYQSTWTKRDPNDENSCFATLPMNSSEMEAVLLGDGTHRQRVMINGRTPSKPIVVPFGAKVLITLHNMQPLERAALHVHGVNKQNRWFFDGIPYLQQCPVESMTSFTYSFIADTAGTHWFHGHSFSERSNGFAGSFIVAKPEATVVRDYLALIEDVPVMGLDDVYYSTMHGNKKWTYGYDGFSKYRCFQCLNTYDGTPVGACYPLQSITVNGKGWHHQDNVRNIPCNLPLETYRIQPGETIRMRIINIGVYNGIMASLEGHTFTVVAADGNDIVPITVDLIVLYPGERFDVLVEGFSNPKKKSFHFIFETLDHSSDDGSTVDPFYGLAALEYENTVEDDSCSVDFKHSTCTAERPCKVLSCPFHHFPPGYPYLCIPITKLKSADPMNDLELTSTQAFASGFQEVFYNLLGNDGSFFKMPGAFVLNHMDNLSAIAKHCDPSCDRVNNRCGCFNLHQFGLNDVVQMTIYNMKIGNLTQNIAPHPFHLHGTHFYVLKMGFGSYDERGRVLGLNPDLNCTAITAPCHSIGWSKSSWNAGNVPELKQNPVLKDTVVVPVGGYVVLRFRATNPGLWLAHCHNMLHSTDGMAFAFTVGENSQIPRPPEGFPTSCGSYTLKEFV